MENFDAIGRWREFDGGQPIDASGVFPDGTTFDGIAGLKREILRRSYVGVIATRRSPAIGADSGNTVFGIDSGMSFFDSLNLVGFYGTGHFWETYDCPDGGEGEAYFYDAGAYMTTSLPGSGSDPLTQAVLLPPALPGVWAAHRPAERADHGAAAAEGRSRR